MEKPFYHNLGEYICKKEKVEELNREIFKESIITINVIITNDTLGNDKEVYRIESLEKEGEFPETMNTFLENINRYLKDGKKGYKTSENSWRIFYLFKELITKLKEEGFNYFRGQREDWSTIPGVFRSVKKQDRYLYQSFEDIYKEISQEFPEELVYVPFEKNDNNKIEIEERANQLAILRHYGLPTALLDITKDPYIAMLFMLSEGSKINTPKFEAYKIESDNDTNIVSFVKKSSKNKRIKAQKGEFINYDKLINFCKFENEKPIFKKEYKPLEKITIKINVSIERSKEYLKGYLRKLEEIGKDNNSSFDEDEFKNNFEKILKDYGIKEGLRKETLSLVTNNLVITSNKKKLSKDTVEDILKKLNDTKEADNTEVSSAENEQQKCFDYLQREVLSKLREFEYYESELFPDFSDYIGYKSREFVQWKKNTNIDSKKFEKDIESDE